VFYTLYQISIGKERFDVLGIAIPNRVSEDVVSSMKEILFRFGISFIIVDKLSWEKIVSSAQESLQFGE
jgi:predicted SpoU family rRNA methylase